MPDSNFANLLNSKLLLVLAWFAALVLLAWAGWSGYQRYQEVVSLRGEIDQAMQPATASTRQQSTITDTRPVQALYLFGRPQKQARPVPVVIDAPVTRLKLRLIGVVAADDVEQSKAIVQIDNKQVAIFRVGDEIPKTNAEVYQIEPIRILLSRNGKLERLEIDRPELDDSEEGTEGKQIYIRASEDDTAATPPAERTSRWAPSQVKKHSSLNAGEPTTTKQTSEPDNTSYIKLIPEDLLKDKRLNLPTPEDKP